MPVAVEYRTYFSKTSPDRNIYSRFAVVLRVVPSPTVRVLYAFVRSTAVTKIFIYDLHGHLCIYIYCIVIVSFTCNLFPRTDFFFFSSPPNRSRSTIVYARASLSLSRFVRLSCVCVFQANNNNWKWIIEISQCRANELFARVICVS